MKTIIINDDGSISCPKHLTDAEKLLLGDFFFDQQETDNEGQFIFYTGIYEDDVT